MAPPAQTQPGDPLGHGPRLAAEAAEVGVVREVVAVAEVIVAAVAAVAAAGALSRVAVLRQRARAQP